MPLSPLRQGVQGLQGNPGQEAELVVWEATSHSGRQLQPAKALEPQPELGWREPPCCWGWEGSPAGQESPPGLGPGRANTSISPLPGCLPLGSSRLL